MADEGRSAADSLTESLSARPYEFDFFQAVRRLECSRPDLPRVGCSQRPDEDPVRFGQYVSLEFSPASVDSFDFSGGTSPARMLVNFMGLLGTNGPMPLPITEYIHDRLHNHSDKTLARFLDVFNHRMISLFYRAWACNQQSVSHDRRDSDRFAAYVGSLIGVGDASFLKRDSVPDSAKLHYSGRFSCPTKNAEGLCEMAEDFFGVPAAIDEFVSQWIQLGKEHLCRLGGARENSIVGSSVIVGSSFRECQHKFRIRLGPMGYADYERLLPNGESVDRLVSMVKNYVGEQFCWEVQLILTAPEVPAVRLGRLGRLGWSSWLAARHRVRDAGDLVLRSLVA